MSTFTLRKTLAKIKAREEAEKLKVEVVEEVKVEEEEVKVELVCEFCGKVYKTRKGLDSHVATKHKESDVNDTR